MKADPLHNESPPFTEEDLDNCWQYYKSYFIDILNGDYDLNTAREDLRGLIGSEWDKRVDKVEQICKICGGGGTMLVFKNDEHTPDEFDTCPECHGLGIVYENKLKADV